MFKFRSWNGAECCFRTARVILTLVLEYYISVGEASDHVAYTLSRTPGGHEPVGRLAERISRGYVYLVRDSDEYLPHQTDDTLNDISASGVSVSGIVGHGRYQPLVKPREGLTAIALFGGHDASIAVSIGGRIQCALELERLFNIRYFGQPKKGQWLRALRSIRDRCECEEGIFPSHFDVGVMVNSFATDGKLDYPKDMVEQVFSVERWEVVDHHYAHGMIGFHASPFRSALVVSYDGGSPDGVFRIFYGTGTDFVNIASLGYNFGHAYKFLAMLMPEVSGGSIQRLCKARHESPRYEVELANLEDGHSLSLPGKLMGYAAIGEPVAQLRNLTRRFLEHGAIEVDNKDQDGDVRDLIDALCESSEPEKTQRALGATVQSEFENISYNIVEEFAELVGKQKVEGIVLTGGCALNVLTNQAIYDGLTGDSLYVPASPHDGGLTVGALWAVMPPLFHQPLQYIGFRLWDEEKLDAVAQNRGAKRLSTLGGVDYLAQLLTGQALDFKRTRGLTNSTMDKPVIAVVRGRQEYGPRALGHRSLLAVPDSDAMRDRMNRLKVRKWYRPVAPMIADEALQEVFGREVKSPYMTMAPVVQEHIRMRFPALAHLDGTARHQSVGKADEPWVHALLLAVGKLTGLAALINTSFNTRGKPIVNTITECMEMLDTLPDLDFVLIEDWLFEKPKDKPKRKKAQSENRDEI